MANRVEYEPWQVVVGTGLVLIGGAALPPHGPSIAESLTKLPPEFVWLASLALAIISLAASGYILRGTEQKP